MDEMSQLADGALVYDYMACFLTLFRLKCGCLCSAVYGGNEARLVSRCGMLCLVVPPLP